MSLGIRWMCRKISPLLVPYAENALPEESAARVREHLDRCAHCREEAAIVADMANLLRGNRPAAPEPATDLWARIQQQIEPAPPQPAPRLTRPWRSYFGVPAIGSIAAAAVVLVAFASGRLTPLDTSGERAAIDVQSETIPTAPAPGSLSGTMPETASSGALEPEAGQATRAADARAAYSAANPQQTPAQAPRPGARVADPAPRRSAVAAGGDTGSKRVRPSVAAAPRPAVVAPRRAPRPAAVAARPSPLDAAPTGRSPKMPRADRVLTAKATTGNPAGGSIADADIATPEGVAGPMPAPAAAPPPASFGAVPEPAETVAASPQPSRTPGSYEMAMLPERLRAQARGMRASDLAANAADPSLLPDVPATASAVEETLSVQRRHGLFRY